METRAYSTETMTLAASQAEVELHNFLTTYWDWLQPSERKSIDTTLGVLRAAQT